MNIHEHQAKDLLKKFGAPVSLGYVATNPEEIDELIVSRDMAREAKNYEKADQIRDQLISRGIVIEDGDQGTKWRIAKR